MYCRASHLRFKLRWNVRLWGRLWAIFGASAGHLPLMRESPGHKQYGVAASNSLWIEEQEPLRLGKIELLKWLTVAFSGGDLSQ
jgi:hypothetical protein